MFRFGKEIRKKFERYEPIENTESKIELNNNSSNKSLKKKNFIKEADDYIMQGKSYQYKDFNNN